MTPFSSFPKPLSKEEQSRLLTIIKNGSETERKQAQNTLVERNLRLVAHVVKKFGAKDVDDMISIGTIGLIKAIMSFNPDKGAKLATYAARCIENAIIT